MSAPFTNISGVLVDSEFQVGTLRDGAPVGVVSFSEETEVVVTHNRSRKLSLVQVLIQKSSFGDGGFGSDEFSVSLTEFEALHTDNYTITYAIDNNSFTVTFNGIYTGEIRFS